MVSKTIKCYDETVSEDCTEKGRSGVTLCFNLLFIMSLWVGLCLSEWPTVCIRSLMQWTRTSASLWGSCRWMEAWRPTDYWCSFRPTSSACPSVRRCSQHSCSETGNICKQCSCKKQTLIQLFLQGYTAWNAHKLKGTCKCYPCVMCGCRSDFCKRTQEANILKKS